MRRALVLAATLALTACGKLQNFGGAEPPLATFDLRFDGELGPLQPAGIADVHALRVALVWGAQWLTEPFCFLKAESAAAAAVIAAGCRDPFGFVPNRVDVGVPISVGEPTTLPLFTLPTADVLVGDVTARVGYASLVVYDDRDDSGTLELSRPHRTPTGGDMGGRGMDSGTDALDIVYGASFLTMTKPDQRVAYREGGFIAGGAFYPRAGCDAPPPGFSVLGAGGFPADGAIAAAMSGMLPATLLAEKDPAACAETAQGAADANVIAITARAPADVGEVDCDERTDDGSSRYREPPTTAPDFTGRVTACAHLPTFDAGATAPTVMQLVVSGRDTDRCKGLTHYTLRGCDDDVACGLPDWDFSAKPPAWWPCPQ